MIAYGTFWKAGGEERPAKPLGSGVDQFSHLMWVKLCQILGMIRFSHTLFALPFALLSAALAWRETPFRLTHLVGILLGMVFARSTAMAFNRLADREYDARNPRTERREIPAGSLSVSSVRIFTVVCAAGFVASTLLFQPNPWPLRLSLPVLMFLCGYSYAKRFTSLCHYWLAAALMLSPVAVWIALRGEVSRVPLLMAAMIFFWVGGFDIIYACQDTEFDRQSGLFSLPSRLGNRRALRVAFFSHMLTICCLVGLWFVSGLGAIFGTGVVLTAVLLIYEHRLIRPEDLTRVNQSFFQVNAVISVGLFAFGLLDLWFC